MFDEHGDPSYLICMSIDITEGKRQEQALRELNIVGIETSAPFHLQVLAEPDFRSGNIDIKYLEKHPELLSSEPSEMTFSGPIVNSPAPPGS